MMVEHDDVGAGRLRRIDRSGAVGAAIDRDDQRGAAVRPVRASPRDWGRSLRRCGPECRSRPGRRNARGSASAAPRTPRRRRRSRRRSPPARARITASAMRAAALTMSVSEAGSGSRSRIVGSRNFSAFSDRHAARRQHARDDVGHAVPLRDRQRDGLLPPGEAVAPGHAARRLPHVQEEPILAVHSHSPRHPRMHFR